MDLSVIIPCYNEEKNVPLIVNRFNEILPKNIEVELILVNNGSTDNSNKIIIEYVQKFKYIQLVYVKKNIGYGNGIYVGLKKAKGDYLCWTHADMQTDIQDTIKAYNLIKIQKNPKKTFVKGTRKNRIFFDNFFTIGMTIFETIILRKFLYDINAQPNLFHKSFIKIIKNPPKDFSFDLYFYYLAKKMNFKIKRFPVSFKKRIHGESHWNSNIKEKIKFIKRTIQFSFELVKRF